MRPFWSAQTSLDDDLRYARQRRGVIPQEYLLCMEVQFHSPETEEKMSRETVESTTGQDKTHLVEDACHKVSIPDRKKLKNSFGPKHAIIWFTDGSKTKEAVRAGCCSQRSKDKYVPRLDDGNNVFQSEVLAIKECTMMLSMRGIPEYDINRHRQSESPKSSGRGNCLLQAGRED